jgi:hypothetical protein
MHWDLVVHPYVLGLHAVVFVFHALGACESCTYAEMRGLNEIFHPLGQ